MAAITREQARTIVIERLRTWISSIPRAEAQMPRMVIGGRVYSPVDLLREVEMSSPTGQTYVNQQISSLGYVIAG